MCSDPSYADSTYGIWPDTLTNLPLAEVDVPYSTVLNFKVPTDIGEWYPQLAGLPVESYTLTSLIGLPSGYEFVCNNLDCSYLADEIGCGTIFGTTSEVGIYPLTFTISVDVNTAFGIIQADITVLGYQIVVIESNAVIENINPVVCGSYTSPSGTIYTESGAYVDTIFQANTIDSIYNIDLTILPTYETTISDFVVKLCAKWTNLYKCWRIYAVLYKLLGCDSIIILNQ